MKAKRGDELLEGKRARREVWGQKLVPAACSVLCTILGRAGGICS